MGKLRFVNKETSTRRIDIGDDDWIEAPETLSYEMLQSFVKQKLPDGVTSEVMMLWKILKK